MADLVNLTIDDRPVTAAAGSLVIETVKKLGGEIPSFCYYPGLSLQAACRMCVVEIEKMPKLQTACTTVVSEGMIVRTESEKVAQARKSALEFLLTNHPLDCPVCDKGGECELQDMVFRYGASESRFAEEKNHVEEKQFSPLVFFDAPRCILCYRCIRVCDEAMDVNALGIAFRGAHSEIIPNQDEKLECEECGMCIDICPVGALTSGPYRYKTRPWEMKYTGTICNHCGDGCKTTLSVRNNEIIRANDRDTSGVNNDFLCIKGRFGWDFVNEERRLTQPLVRREGQLAASSWDAALGRVAEQLNQIVARHGSNAVGVIGSNHTTNEENYTLQRFARTLLGTNNIDHHRSADFSGLVAALTRAQATDRHATFDDFTQASSVLLIGSNPTDEHPLVAYRIREAVRLRQARLYLINSEGIRLRRQAAIGLKIQTGQEANLVQALANGETSGGKFIEGGEDELNRFREKLAAETDTIIVFGDEIKGEAIEPLVRWGLSMPGRTRFLALADAANSRGAADMALLPDILPGYQPLNDAAARGKFEKLWGAQLPSQEGLNLRTMAEAIANGNLKALLVFGANPVRSLGLDPAALSRLELLVVADLFRTETAEAAHVVLPAASFAEKEGTVTNTSGEVQRLREALRKPGVKTDLEILTGLARLMGQTWESNTPADVLREIVEHVPGYSISLSNLLLGNALPTQPSGTPPPLARPDLVFSSHDTLFTSGTLGRYSWALNAVEEAKQTA